MTLSPLKLIIKEASTKSTRPQSCKVVIVSLRINAPNITVKNGKKDRKGMTLLNGDIEIEYVSKNVPDAAKIAVIKPGNK